MSQHEGSKKRWVRVLAVLTLLAPTFFGTGAYWQYRRLDLDQDRQDWDRLERVAASREHLNEILLEAHRIKATLDSIMACDPMTEDRRIQFAAGDLATRLEALTDDFGAIEGRLAAIEGREPRAIHEWYFGYGNRLPGPPAVAAHVLGEEGQPVGEWSGTLRHEPTGPCPAL